MPKGGRSRSSSREHPHAAAAGVATETPPTSEDDHEESQRQKNLPREIRHIARHLDRHQADAAAALQQQQADSTPTILSLQGEMSRMTELMSTMSAQFLRFAVRESREVMDPITSMNKGAAFSTPPPTTPFLIPNFRKNHPKSHSHPTQIWPDPSRKTTTPRLPTLFPTKPFRPNPTADIHRIRGLDSNTSTKLSASSDRTILPIHQSGLKPKPLPTKLSSLPKHTTSKPFPTLYL